MMITVILPGVFEGGLGVVSVLTIQTERVLDEGRRRGLKKRLSDRSIFGRIVDGRRRSEGEVARFRLWIC